MVNKKKDVYKRQVIYTVTVTNMHKPVILMIQYPISCSLETNNTIPINFADFKTGVFVCLFKRLYHCTVSLKRLYINKTVVLAHHLEAVSYTHLDVYKRQVKRDYF